MRLATRVERLEAQTGGPEVIPGLIIYREGESPEETLTRLGLTSEDIGERFTIWLPETEVRDA